MINSCEGLILLCNRWCVCMHTHVVCILPWHTWVSTPLMPFRSIVAGHDSGILHDCLLQTWPVPDIYEWPLWKQAPCALEHSWTSLALSGSRESKTPRSNTGPYRLWIHGVNRNSVRNPQTAEILIMSPELSLTGLHLGLRTRLLQLSQ